MRLTQITARIQSAMDLNGSESPANTPFIEHNENRVFNTRLRALKQCAMIRMRRGVGEIHGNRRTESCGRAYESLSKSLIIVEDRN